MEELRTFLYVQVNLGNLLSNTGLGIVVVRLDKLVRGELLKSPLPRAV